MKTKKLVSVKIEGLDCVIGKSTKKYNTVTMRVDRTTILPVAELFESEKNGNPPETGLIGLELHAVYADGEVEKEQLDLIQDGGEVVGDELADDKPMTVKEAFDSLTETITEAISEPEE